MLTDKRSLIVSAALVGILTVGISSCSFSSETKTTLSTETTTEDGTTETKTTETTTTVGTDGSSTQTTETTTTTTGSGDVTTTTTTTTSDGHADTVISMDAWTKGWMGDTSKGFTAFYTESPEGGAQGMLVLYDKASGTIESFIGANEAQYGDSEDDLVVTITDAGSGHNFTFELINHADDGNLDINLGEEYGTGTLEYVGMQELVTQIKSVDTAGSVFV